MGYSVTLCVPENVTPERKRILRAYGAELMFTNPLEGSDGAIRTAQKMNDADPGKYFYADQYNNDFNWRSHYDTTGPEIIRQTGGAADALRGRPRHERHVRRRGPPACASSTTSIVLASVQPDSPLHGLEGLKHMESAIVPGIYDPTLADEDVRVGTEEAYEMTRRLAQEEGLLVGISSGANLAGALKVARERRGVVVVFCDGGERYLSERFWENPPEGALDLRHELMATGADRSGGCRDSCARARDVSARVLRRAARPRRRGAAKRSRCRTPPKKARAAASWCGPTITASRRSARAKRGSTCSASITRIRIIRRSRRSTISITRGRRSRT